MAVCNIFKELKNNTGTFLTFSQYVEDLTREATQSVYYHIIPSKFIAMDINYSNFTNDTIVRTLQNEFENGCAVCRNSMENEWKPSNSTNLFWNTLFNNDLLSGDTYINEIKYVGDINLQSYNEHDGIGYSEIYCYIPNEASEYKYEYKFFNNNPEFSSGSYIEGYTESELGGWGQLADTSYSPNSYYLFPWENDTVSAIISNNTSFNINTIVVLYDIVSKTDNGNSYIYKNIPLGIYFTGIIDDNGKMTNNITKYCSSNDIFGAGTSYGLRICSRFSVTPNQDNIKVLDVTLENDNYSAISQVMSQMAISQTKMDEILTKIQSNNIAEKELLAIFKNSKTNVPYLKSVNGKNNWFVNGRCLGPAISEDDECVPYEEQEILNMLNKTYNLLIELTVTNSENNNIFDYSEYNAQDIQLDWNVIFNNKFIIPDQLFLNGEEIDKKLIGCVIKNVYNTTTYNIKAKYDGMEASAESKVYFVYPTFFGTMSCNDTCGKNIIHDFRPTEKSILELNKYTNISNKNKYTYTNITKNNGKTDHVVYAYPKEFGLLTSIIDTFGYEYLNDFFVREIELTIKGQKIPYYVYVDKIPAEVYDFTLSFK